MLAGMFLQEWLARPEHSARATCTWRATRQSWSGYAGSFSRSARWWRLIGCCKARRMRSGPRAGRSSWSAARPTWRCRWARCAAGQASTARCAASASRCGCSPPRSGICTPATCIRISVACSRRRVAWSSFQGRPVPVKSTTLAALIEELNGSRATHIVTLESPLEYLLREPPRAHPPARGSHAYTELRAGNRRCAAREPRRAGYRGDAHPGGHAPDAQRRRDRPPGTRHGDATPRAAQRGAATTVSVLPGGFATKCARAASADCLVGASCPTPGVPRRAAAARSCHAASCCCRARARAARFALATSVSSQTSCSRVPRKGCGHTRAISAGSSSTTAGCAPTRRPRSAPSRSAPAPPFRARRARQRSRPPVRQRRRPLRASAARQHGG